MNQITGSIHKRDNESIKFHCSQGHVVYRYVYVEMEDDIRRTEIRMRQRKWTEVRCYTCVCRLADWNDYSKRFVEEDLHETTHG
jgi:hypothetical protein